MYLPPNNSFQFEKDSCLQASTERLHLPSECAGVKAQDIQFKKTQTKTKQRQINRELVSFKEQFLFLWVSLSAKNLHAQHFPVHLWDR